MKTKGTRPERLRQFLESLGDTPDEIAARLKRWGIKGRRKSYSSCPIANALQAKFGRGFVAVSAGSATVNGARAQLPAACNTFIRAFDRSRRYRSLVAKP